MSEERSAFVAALRDCADTLARDPDDGKAPLRILQSKAHNLLDGCDDRALKVLAFLVDEWVADYYFNFAGDVLSPASEIIDKVRCTLLRNDVAEALRSLASDINSQDCPAFSSLERLILPYLDAIARADEHVGCW